MPTILKFPSPRPQRTARRFLVGLKVGSACGQLCAALVAAEGGGLQTRAEVIGLHSAPIAPEIAQCFRRLDGGQPVPAMGVAQLRTALAECQTAAVGELLAAAGIAPGRVLALGVNDPGLWRFEPGGRPDYLGLCDPALLAEGTGLNVVDAFPARDLAQGGQGGPVAPLAEWVLLRDRKAARCLLDLGRTFRLTYLPAEAEDPRADTLRSFDVGPGMHMLDLLAQRLTGGAQHCDTGGRLAVQGKRIGPLVEHWLSDPYFDRPVPRWHPRGVPPERFLGQALEMAVAHDWSIRDLLCSATHFLAETVALALRNRPLADVRVDRLIVSGGGQHNGLLLREISRLTGLQVMRLDQLGTISGSSDDQAAAGTHALPQVSDGSSARQEPRPPRIAQGHLHTPGGALEAAAAALLALLHLDQVPANRPEITGAEVPRLLGRLTPGHPQSWRRLLECCAGQAAPARPLRSAL